MKNNKIIKSKTGHNDTQNGEIMVPLKYLSHFWKILEMPILNCEINVDLNWSKMSVIVATDIANKDLSLSVTDTKPYAPVVTLSTQDNAKLLKN